MTKRRGLDRKEVAREFTRTPEQRHGDATETSQERRDNAAETPEVKASESTTTAGGLLRRTVYFAPEEWADVLAAAEATDRSAAALVRIAVRRYLGELES